MGGETLGLGPSLLAVQGLTVALRRDHRVCRILRDVSLDVRPGGRLALVGESGCGKSLTCMALTRLPPVDAAACGGRVCFEGRDLLQAGRRELRAVRQGGIAYVFQDPTGSLNPVVRIGVHLDESLPSSVCRSRRARRAICRDLLADVGLPPERLDAYPGALSGGQRQRVMIAMALAARPRLIVTDEPTTALDVRNQKQVLDRIHDGCRQTGAAWLLVTHNLAVAAAYAEMVAVMYAGTVVECGPVRAVLRRPRHPYTRGLLNAVPALDTPRGQWRDIPGDVPPGGAEFPGCPFAPRCVHVRPDCTEAPVAETIPEAGHRLRCRHPLSCPIEDSG